MGIYDSHYHTEQRCDPEVLRLASWRAIGEISDSVADGFTLDSEIKREQIKDVKREGALKEQSLRTAKMKADFETSDVGQKLHGIGEVLKVNSSEKVQEYADERCLEILRDIAPEPKKKGKGTKAISESTEEATEGEGH